MVSQTSMCFTPKVSTEKHIYTTTIIWDAECTWVIQLPVGNPQPPVITMECKLRHVKMHFAELSSTCFFLQMSFVCIKRLTHAERDEQLTVGPK